MKKSRLLFYALAALLSGPLHAGSNRWTSSGPDHTYVRSITVDPSNGAVAYAVTDASGIYKTTNDGQRWRAANEGLPNTYVTLLILGGDPNTLYAVANDALFVSTDAAAHWSSLRNPGHNNTVLAFDRRSQTLYAGTDDGLFRSIDGGQTWDATAAAYPRNAFALQSMAVAADGTVYALLSSGALLTSVDQGRTWSHTVDLPNGFNIVANTQSEAVYVTTGRGALISQDAGKNWKTLPNIAPAGVYVTSLLPTDPGRLYASTNLGVYEYTDASGAWSHVGNGLSATVIRSLAASSSLPRHLYAAMISGIVTNDGEAFSDWTEANRGLPFKFMLDVAAVMADPSRAYATGTDAAFTTGDRGQNWQLTKKIPELIHVTASPSEPDTAYLSGQDLRKTVDGGATWQTIQTDFVNVLAIAPSDTATIYASFANAIKKSVDGGHSWMNIGADIPMTGYDAFYYSSYYESSSIAVDPSNAAIVYLGESDGIYKTVDGGTSWKRMTLGGSGDLAIDPSAPSVVYALFGRGVSKSVDGGATWISAGLFDESVRSLAIAATRSVIFAGTANGKVYQSTDGGTNWSPFAQTGLQGASIRKLTVDAEGDHLYAATERGVFQFEWDRKLEKAAVYQITLGTSGGNFVSAADCGDGATNANAATAGPCETFTLYDVTNTALMDGDQIILQANDGSFVTAEHGGSNACSGCASPLNANRAFAGAWETFTIHKVNGPGPITSADSISLLSSAGNYISAENGGTSGCGCDSPINANRLIAGPWETFTLSMQ